MNTRTLIPLLLLPLAVACGEKEDTGDTADSAVDTADTGAPEEIDLSTLDQSGSCSDVYFAKWATDGSLLLEVTTVGQTLAEDARSAGTTQTLSVDLATETTARVELKSGVDLDNYPCNDALFGTEEVHNTWTSVSGTLDFEVVPDSGGGGGFEPYGEGEVVLTGVIVEDASGERHSIPDMTLSGGVGWYPG